MTNEGIVAAALRRELQLPARVDLEALATRLKLRIVEVNARSFEGALLRSSNRYAGRILIRHDIREAGRRRFTLAHEIGHFFLHGEQQTPCSPRVIEGWREGQPPAEQQADAFASELLLPTELVQSCINKRWPSLEVVSDLATTFGASLTAAARKFCDVASQSCAVAWSSNRQIRWFHGSPSFTHFVKVGQNIGYDSMARLAYERKGPVTEMQEVPAEEWIASEKLLENATVLEQSQAMPFYGGCLSLIWIKRPIEKAWTEDDDLLAKLDPEGFTIRRSRWPR